MGTTLGLISRDVASVSKPRSRGRLEAPQRLASVSPRTGWRTPRSRLGLGPGRLGLGLGLGLVGLVHKVYFMQNFEPKKFRRIVTLKMYIAAAKSAIAYLLIV